MNISHNERLWELYCSLPGALQNIAVSGAGWFKRRKEYGKALRCLLTQYLEHERCSTEELQHIQVERLKALLVHAQRNVPYYTRLFAERGFDPASVKNPSDLQALPLLTKRLIRENYDALISRDHNKRGSFETRSSGTTGTPVVVLQDKETLLHEKVWIARHRLAHGFFPGREWRGTFNGTRVIPSRREKPPFWRINRPGRQILFSSRHIGVDTVDSYVRFIERSKIESLDGYPSTLFIFARLINLRGLRLPLRAVFCGAEPLFSHYRAEMERAFGCQVHDYYGLAEKNISAGDCPHKSGLHVGMDDSIVEIVEANTHEVIREPGRHGILVGTSLVNYSMPLIRYATGDVSSFLEGSCPCGRTMPRIEPVFSKLKDLIITPRGRWLAGPLVTYPIQHIQGVLESQIAQTDRDKVEVRIVPINELSRKDKDYLNRSFREQVGDDMQIAITMKESIDRTPSGKYLSVTSEIDNGLPRID